MRPLQTDLSVYDQLNFSRPPVGVKFLFFRPENMDQLPMDKNLSFCEMLKEAQDASAPFYFSKDNNETCVGKILLGMEEMESFAESGQIGARLEIFQEPRANCINNTENNTSLLCHSPRLKPRDFIFASNWD